MKTYRSHKLVQAAKIVRAEYNPADGLTIETEGGETHKIDRMEETRFARLTPEDKGYLVRYVDGYTSWSPTAAFEEGYTEVEADTAKQPQDLTDIPVKVLNDLKNQYEQVQVERKAEEPGEYHRGYYNGIILAHATVFGHEPDFIEASE